MDTKHNAAVINDMIRRYVAGAGDIKPQDWTEFVAAQNDGYRTGPEIGEKVPDFALTDQHGKSRALAELMGPNGLLLVFVRSAHWWPYCRNQLVELQHSLKNLRAHGVNVASISYDSREVLRVFGDTYKIEYPLLSDVGSKVIRAFGIFNTNVSEDNQMLYGIPFPGDYLIAPDGTVRDKVFLPDYQYRPTVSELMLRNFADDSGGSAVEVVTSALTARISLSTDRCFPGQELGVALKFSLRPGWHVYGKPLPDNYQHLQVVFDGEIVGRQSIEFPPAKPLMLKALGETMPVYEGEFRALGKLGIKWSPPPEVKFLGDSLGKRIEPGPYRLIGTLRFQACSDEVCEPPQAIRFELPLTLEPDAPPAASKAD